MTKLNGLGRSPEHLTELAKQLLAKDADLQVPGQSINASTAVGQMCSQILGAIIEFENALRPESTMDGIAAAWARGRTARQTLKLRSRRDRLAGEMYGEGGDGERKYTVKQIAAEFGATGAGIDQNIDRSASVTT